MAEKIISHEEVCELLGVSRATLWAWRKDRTKDFPTAKWDMSTRSLVWLRKDVEAWIKAQDDDNG